MAILDIRSRVLALFWWYFLLSVSSHLSNFILSAVEQHRYLDFLYLMVVQEDNDPVDLIQTVGVTVL